MNDVFQSIKQGLTEAIEFAQGQTTGAVVHEFAPLDIKAVRAKVGMTQNAHSPMPSVSPASGSMRSSMGGAALHLQRPYGWRSSSMSRRISG